MLRTKNISREFQEAGALMAQLNLYGFWDDYVFLTKSGDLGCALRVHGVDYESQDGIGRDMLVRRIESAFRTLDQHTRLYQILLRHNRPKIPHAEYTSPLVRESAAQRAKFLERKADCLYSADVFWILMVDGFYAKSGLMHALAQLPKSPGTGLRELAGAFQSGTQRTMLREQIERRGATLLQKANSLSGQLSDLMQIELPGAEETFRLIRRLINLCPSKIEDSKLRSPRHLDWQLCDSELEAHRGHLRIDDYFVRVLTLKELPGETRPLVLNALLAVPGNFHVVMEWHPVDAGKARKEIAKRRRHYHNAKTSFVSNLQDQKNAGPQDNLIDDSKQAAVAELGEALTAIGQDGKSLGELTLTAVAYDLNSAKVDSTVAELQKVFATADGLLYEERYNLLNALFATVPGNRQFNLRKLWALNSHHADMTFAFSLDRGKERNTHLDAEYLAVFETENATPYYLNLHSGDVAHTLILGATGSGKSFLTVYLLQSAQKYAPLTFIFDLGASYESLTRVFGGTYLNVGLASQGFSINPFSLEPTPDNLNFLFLFARVLIEANGRYALSPEDERALYAALERMYKLGKQMRTLTNFASILGPLGERLHRWTRAGQFGHLFDNVEDTLSFARFQTFNFDGWSEYPDLLEPLLFYVLQRASSEIKRAENAATFKMFVIDEAWMFLKNATIREWVTRAEKTWRKKNGAMILATQTVVELASSEMLHIVNESCPTKIFLANPNIDRDLYARVFQLNDTEMELLESLVPKRDLLLKQPGATKKLRLEVDSLGYWMATNNARDNVRKQDYFARFGPEQGLIQLAQDFPVTP